MSENELPELPGGELPDVPEIVSIDEAVEIARDFSGEKGGNFINGVLNAVKNTIVKE